MKKLTTQIILSIILCSIATQTLWASGKLEEKYIIVLENRSSHLNRNLEKEFFEYANNQGVEIFVTSPTTKTLGNLQTSLSTAVDNQYPIIILQSFEPTVIDTVINNYYKQGTFTITGYMGGFVFIDAVPTQDKHLELRLPWKSIGFDTTMIANEILRSLENHNSNIHADNETKNVNPSQVLVIIDSISQEEISLSLQIYKALKLLNTNGNVHIQDIYSTITTDTQEKNKEIEQNLETRNSQKTQKNTKNYKNKLQQALFEYLTSLLDNNQLTTDITAIVLPHDEFADDIIMSFKDFYNQYNITNYSMPQLIGFGGSPEAKQAIIKDKMLLTFELDFKTYVKKIMTVAFQLFQEVGLYVVTDEMIEDKSLEQTFTSEPVLFPVIAITKDKL